MATWQQFMRQLDTTRLCSNNVWGLLTFDVTTTKCMFGSKQKNNQKHYQSCTLTLMFKGLHIRVCDAVPANAGGMPAGTYAPGVVTEPVPGAIGCTPTGGSSMGGGASCWCLKLAVTNHQTKVVLIS